MAKSPKKRTKQGRTCVAKNSPVALRGQDLGIRSASYWLGVIVVFCKAVIALESLLMVVMDCSCILI